VIALEESARKITINDSRINITFKNSDIIEISELTEKTSPLTVPKHIDTTTDIFKEIDEMIGLEKVKSLIFENLESFL